MLNTGKKEKILAAITMAFILSIMFGCNRDQTKVATELKPSTTRKAGSTFWNFDKVPFGKLPAGWKVDATNQKGSLPIWKVTKDTTAPSGKRVLTMTNPSHTSGSIFNIFSSTFNIIWTDTPSFLNGEIDVRFKALKGDEDQGGGVIWRVQDKDNYYIARFNPLEDNFRIYYVHDGSRKTLADAKIALPANEWYTLKIVQHDNRFEGYLNGKKLLEGTDNLFTKTGGVGLWTKSDAVTSFDDFSLKLFSKRLD